MGTVTSMVQKVSLGCRSRKYSFDEFKNCYDDNIRPVIPVALEDEYVIAVNECGEEIVIVQPKWWNVKIED